MQYKDYYKILGVERTASEDAIKKAYRRLARKYHPDVSKEAAAEERFKEVSEAYEVLRDAEKRAAYDQLGQNWQSGQDFRPPPGWHGQQRSHVGGAGFSSSDFSDFFESLFGGRSGFGGFADMGRGAGGFAATPGQDQTVAMEISLEEAYNGASRSVQLQIPEHGSRTANRTRVLNVKIPAGVTNGQKIRLAGQGGAGVGSGANGDLYLEISIRPHAMYRVRGRDILLELPLTPWEAALGCKIEVPTPGGSVTLNVPANAQSGQKLRLRGRGMPGDPPGNQIVSLRIVNPPADTVAAREFFQRMAQELKFNPRSAWRA